MSLADFFKLPVDLSWIGLYLLQAPIWLVVLALLYVIVRLLIVNGVATVWLQETYKTKRLKIKQSNRKRRKKDHK